MTSEAEAKPVSNSGQVQSLIKALRLMEFLSVNQQGMTLKQLSTSAGYPPSTTHRLLSTLQQEGFIRFDQERLKWSIGVKAFIVGNAFIKNRDLVQVARPIMFELMEASGETVNLAVRDQGQAVYLSQVESRQMMRAMAAPGTSVPLHCSAVGKLMLASMSADERATVIRKYGLIQLTAKSISNPSNLNSELMKTASRGYGIDDEEHVLGLRCVAALIHDELNQPIAALSLSGPALRVTEDKLPMLGKLVLEHAERVTANYGGSVRGQRIHFEQSIK